MLMEDVISAPSSISVGSERVGEKQNTLPSNSEPFCRVCARLFVYEKNPGGVHNPHTVSTPTAMMLVFHLEVTTHSAVKYNAQTNGRGEYRELLRCRRERCRREGAASVHDLEEKTRFLLENQNPFWPD